MSTFQIKPFPRVAMYPTSWAQPMTFEQLHDDLTHYASNVMKSYGILPHQLPDCLQNGFMALWETLSAQRDFLAQKTRRQAVFFILARSKISTMQYQAGMYDSLDALVTHDWNRTADEQIDGMQHRNGERWAGWATEIDMRIDIERIMHKLANKYMSSTKHLVALYYHTTQVGKEAAAIAGKGGTKKCWWLTSVVKPMRSELCEKLELFAPTKETWQDRYSAGIEAPLLRLVERYEADGNLRMVATPQSMAAYESCK